MIGLDTDIYCIGSRLENGHVKVNDFTAFVPHTSPWPGRVEEESDKFSQTFTPQTSGVIASDARLSGLLKYQGAPLVRSVCCTAVPPLTRWLPNWS